MTTKVDHNYPTAGNLRVLDAETSEPVASASIKIYKASSYPPVVSERDIWVASTVTDANGNWETPVFLPDDESWVVEASKRTMYSKVTAEIDT